MKRHWVQKRTKSGDHGKREVTSSRAEEERDVEGGGESV